LLHLRARTFAPLTKNWFKALRNRSSIFSGPKSPGTFRDAHDVLRRLWELSHDDDPPIGLLRALLENLPKESREYFGKRAPRVILMLFRETIAADPFEPSEHTYDRFLDWARAAEGPKLVCAIRCLSGEGGRLVQGRSRGPGKRSGPRLGPSIMGEVRGVGSVHHRGGRPDNAGHRGLVTHLVMDWSRATGEEPKLRRSDHTGFGDLVHCVFEWAGLPEGRTAHSLRQHWSDVQNGRAHR
jgi:hypothetical protein